MVSSAVASFLTTLPCAGLSFTANSFLSKAVGWESVDLLLKARPSAYCPRFCVGVRGSTSTTSTICFFNGGCSHAVSPRTVLCVLGRFEAAAATARNGELTAFGTLARGTLRFDIVLVVFGDCNTATDAMRNDTAGAEGS